MGKDGQSTEQPRLDEYAEEAMGEADTHLNREARADAEHEVVEAEQRSR
jgi:hypothetical protein